LDLYVFAYGSPLHTTRDGVGFWVRKRLAKFYELAKKKAQNHVVVNDLKKRVSFAVPTYNQV
jgi:hypothetical protein